jgi:hypothetical protein
LFAERGGDDTGTDEMPGHVSADFDQLRWFDLPAACLTLD